MASRRDLALLVGAVGLSAAGDFLALSDHRRMERRALEFPAAAGAPAP